ncbi:hypothetical protein WA026_017423 [Henosepilachna vigintioctopunctata]|uniref:Protein sleepless n=1 Tax=Henosepilachna vigintioctopunctata TaxID=420089 RepID=A0AAW1VB76_9CUCU
MIFIWNNRYSIATNASTRMYRNDSLKMLWCCVLVFLIFCNSQSNALNCYTCSSTENDYVDACVSSPTKDFVRSCDKKYCNIIRIEYKDPKDRIASMSRGCSNSYLSGIVEDSTYRSYQVSCKENYCNSGSGKTKAGSHNYIGDKSTIYCPGSNSSSTIGPLIPVFILILVINLL